jgi:dihydropteroate synthase
MPRKPYYLKLDHRELALGQHTLLAGVLNLTPDSFSDAGRYQDPDRAYARALELEEQGAAILDIGAESTHPGSSRVTAAIELQRLVPVLKRLRGKLGIPISIDTYKAEVAERAIELGAEIINDPSGLTFDAGLAKVVLQYNAGLILNHMRGRPETWSKLPPLSDVMGTITKELEATASRARRAGVDKTRIVIDPGLGFGKRKEQNSEIIARLSQLASLDMPILVGPSKKSFLAHQTPVETQFATAAAVTASILAGAHIVRVHDVAEMLAVAQLADEIAKSAELQPLAPDA